MAWYTVRALEIEDAINKGASCQLLKTDFGVIQITDGSLPYAYTATLDSYDGPGAPIACAATVEKAIADLLEQLEES